MSATWRRSFGTDVREGVTNQHYLGSAIVDTKTNEIPVVRELFRKFDLDGRKVSLDRPPHPDPNVSHLEDQCRVRKPKSMRVMGMFRRFSNSLFMYWRSRQHKPHHKTTTDFFSAMNAEHHRYAIRCLHARQPSFQTVS